MVQATSPVHGTPINGIGDVARMALHANAAAQRALSPTNNGTQSMSGSTGSASNTPYLANLMCFRVCSCWRRKEKNVLNGDVIGCYWVADSIPVIYWRKWKGKDGNDKLLPPDSFWQEYVLQEHDLPTEIWWVQPGSSCCCDDNDPGSSTNPAVCPSNSENPPCDETDDWQAAIPPKYGVGDYVWCTYEYSSGTWRIIDAYDPIIQFQLAQPMKGCHGSARAYLLADDCEGSFCNSSGSLATFGPCGTQLPPSSEECASSCCDDKTLRKRAIIRLHDPRGIVNTAFRKPWKAPLRCIHPWGDHLAENIPEILCTYMCNNQPEFSTDQLADDMAAYMCRHRPIVDPPGGTFCDAWPGTPAFDQWISAYLCEYMKQYTGSFTAWLLGEGLRKYLCEYMKQYMQTYMTKFMTCFMGSYSDRLAKSIYDSQAGADILPPDIPPRDSGEAPVGTFGWAKYNSVKRRFEVISYGDCKCCGDLPPTPQYFCVPPPIDSSGSASEPCCGSSEVCDSCDCECPSSSSQPCSDNDCPWPLPPSSDCSGPVILLPRTISVDTATCTLNVQYCEACVQCGQLTWKDDCLTTTESICCPSCTPLPSSSSSSSSSSSADHCCSLDNSQSTIRLGRDGTTVTAPLTNNFPTDSRRWFGASINLGAFTIICNGNGTWTLSGTDTEGHSINVTTTADCGAFQLTFVSAFGTYHWPASMSSRIKTIDLRELFDRQPPSSS